MEKGTAGGSAYYYEPVPSSLRHDDNPRDGKDSTDF